MRLGHLILLVAAVAVMMTLAREPVTRVLMITLGIGLGEVALGLVAVMALFQTIGALGEARGLVAHAEALAATTLVLTLATAVMSGILFVGFWLVANSV